jgi:hypothetical protein
MRTIDWTKRERATIERCIAQHRYFMDAAGAA